MFEARGQPARRPWRSKTCLLRIITIIALWRGLVSSLACT